MKPTTFTIHRLILALCVAVLLAVAGVSVSAQTTEFTYQGQLQNSSALANGNFDFEFLLFDSLAGPNQIGSTLTRSSIAVNNGIFSVKLDFGTVYPGASRFLEIHVRQTGGGSFIPLTPRQAVSNTPYAVKSLNADNATNATSLNNQPASFYTNASNLTTGSIPVAQLGNTAILNQAGPQAGANYNISGTGTAGILNAATQFNLAGSRILSIAGTNNLFAGFNAGVLNDLGSSNAFFGKSSGASNTEGDGNSFFGESSGAANTVGDDNSFFGVLTGSSNTTGNSNSFFGEAAGEQTTAGNANSFFGFVAGARNITGGGNTTVGYGADVASGNLINATAIGSNALVGQSNSLVLGGINGVNGATADTKVGIGTTTPNSRLDVQGDIAIGLSAAPNSPGNYNLYIANDNGGDAANVFRLDGSSDNFFMVARSNAGAATGTNIGFRTAAAGGGETTRMFINSTGTITINTLGSAGSTALCRNTNNEISTCSSSLRYKTNIKGFSSGLAFVNQLRPISFDWKDGGMKDVGFGAEDVAKIDPRFVTYNDKGEVEGVKYDRLSAVFVNAFKEQQAQIEAQQKQIDQQSKQIESLTKIVCAMSPKADICR